MDEDWWAGLIWFCAISAFVWFVWLGDSKFRYEIQYAEAVVDDKPHDCEFMTAPLGKKNCSYQKEVSIALFSRDTKKGEPIISFDEGKTWTRNLGGPTKGERVYVSWVKTND